MYWLDGALPSAPQSLADDPTRILGESDHGIQICGEKTRRDRRLLGRDEPGMGETVKQGVWDKEAYVLSLLIQKARYQRAAVLTGNTGEICVFCKRVREYGRDCSANCARVETGKAVMKDVVT